jgi:predicted nucleic acid-binding protein
VIFVDSGAWFARFVPDDPQHGRITAWFSQNSQPLVTTDYCIDETLTLLVVRGRPKLAAQVGRLFFDESLARIHFLTRSQIERAFIFFQQRSSAGWSFTDCTSKIAIEDLGASSALALDDHFRQFGVTVFP